MENTKKMTFGKHCKKMTKVWRENWRKRRKFNAIKKLEPLENRDTPSRYIVSLTSYGKRLTNTAPYAIATLLNQSVKPDKIILWVANEDRNNIPQIMAELIEKGLEIRYCEDIKSYKKLIPALESFPDDYIITADDDVYYPHDWFKQLIAEHKKNPNKIICHRAHGITVDENHNPLPYNEWVFYVEPHEQSLSRHQPECLFPTGCNGTLYPPHCLANDVTNRALFMKLAPQADDIWFWAMAVINKKYFGEESPYIVIGNGYSRNLQDIETLQTRDGNALWNYNSQGGNDKQLKAVIEQYPQIIDVLNKIKPYFNSDIISIKSDISVSIIVPVFNAEQFIERGFNSIIRQTYRNDKIEVIFVDDCSTDNSVKILEKFVENYHGQIKFKILKHTKNKGASQTRNTGIENVHGEYLYFMDADDEITPNAILILANLAQKYKGVDIVQGNTYRIEAVVNGVWQLDKMWDIAEYNFPEYVNDKLWIKQRLGMWVRNTFPTERGYIPHSSANKLIATSFIKKNNLYFEKNSPVGEDQLWNFFASKLIKDIAFTNYYSYIYHREHAVSLSKNETTYKNIPYLIDNCSIMLNNLDTDIIELQLKTIHKYVGFYIRPELNKLKSVNKKLKRKFEREAAKIKYRALLLRLSLKTGQKRRRLS